MNVKGALEAPGQDPGLVPYVVYNSIIPKNLNHVGLGRGAVVKSRGWGAVSLECSLPSLERRGLSSDRSSKHPLNHLSGRSLHGAAGVHNQQTDQTNRWQTGNPQLPPPQWCRRLVPGWVPGRVRGVSLRLGSLDRPGCRCGLFSLGSFKLECMGTVPGSPKACWGSKGGFSWSLVMPKMRWIGTSIPLRFP